MDGDETLAEQTSAQERRWSWKGTRRWTGPWHRRPRSWRLRTAVLPVVAALSLSGSMWLLLSGAGLPKTTVRPAVLPGAVVAPKPTPPPTGPASSQPRTGAVPPSSDETAGSAPTAEPPRLSGEQIPPGTPAASPSEIPSPSPPALAPPPLPPPVPVLTSTPPVCPPLPSKTRHQPKPKPSRSR